MIFSLTRKRNTPLDIPFQSNAAARLAPWAIGTMTFLAALALGAVFALSDFEERWRVALAKAVTVQLPPCRIRQRNHQQKPPLDKKAGWPVFWRS